MDFGLARFVNRGIRFAASKVATTYVGLKLPSSPVTSFDLSLPVTLPASVQALTVDASGQLAYATINSLKVHRQSFVNAALTAGILTVTHTIGSQYVSVTVVDDSNKVFAPDDITYTSSTVFTVDLSSLGSIVGSYNLVAIG